MSELLTFKIDGDMVGKRLDALIAKQFDKLSRNFVQSLIESGEVSVNGVVEATKRYKVKIDDTIEVAVPDPVTVAIEPEDIPFDVIYEDNDVVVVNKPQGMVVHPAPGNYTGTLVNALMYHFKGELSSINGELRPGIVHRIDKDTSGLLVVAKNNHAHKNLSAQLADHSINRRYLAIVYNNIKEDEGTIDLPIGRDPKNRLHMAVVEGGKRAVTHYKVIERFGKFTLVELRLETGRTHQIRVHMAYKKHPILGDEVYGPKSKVKGGQLLHARLLGFNHPTSSEYLEFQSEPPTNFNNALIKLKGD